MKNWEVTLRKADGMVYTIRRQAQDVDALLKVGHIATALSMGASIISINQAYKPINS